MSDAADMYKEALGLASDTWPVRLLKSLYGAVTLPGDVYTGKADLNSNKDFGRVVDLAGLAVGGGVPFAEKGAVGSSGGKLMSSPTHVDVIKNAINDADYYSYGLRTSDEPFTVGKKLGNSRIWFDGMPTEMELEGASTSGVRSGSEDHIKAALRNQGIGGNGPNGYYPGEHVALVRGSGHSMGEDVGEYVIKDPEVVATFRKMNDRTGSIKE
jgi:hypothetical protein